MGEEPMIPVLEGSKITLRPHTLDDVEAVYERSVDPTSLKYTTIPVDYTHDLARAYIETTCAPSNKRLDWAIEHEGRYAGSIDIRTFGLGFTFGAAEIGYITSPWARGRGLMTEAVSLAVDETFRRGVQLIRWRADAGNLGSWKPVWRNGFRDFIEVPYLLPGRDGLHTGWQAVLHCTDRRTPSTSWDNGPWHRSPARTS